MVKKRGALQDVLIGTSEKVNAKVSKVVDVKKDLGRATPRNRRTKLKVRYKKLNMPTSPTKRV